MDLRIFRKRNGNYHHTSSLLSSSTVWACSVFHVRPPSWWRHGHSGYSKLKLLDFKHLSITFLKGSPVSWGLLQRWLNFLMCKREFSPLTTSFIITYGVIALEIKQQKQEKNSIRTSTVWWKLQILFWFCTAVITDGKSLIIQAIFYYLIYFYQGL